MRGKHASKPIEDVVAEARELVADGVKELIIVAQDTTYYGMDIYGKPGCDRIAPRLERSTACDWIRLMYFYPMYITDELLDVIAGQQEDPALHRHAFAAHRRRRAPPHARATTREKTERLVDGSAIGFPKLVAADDAHRRLPRRDRRAIRADAGVRPAAEVRAARQQFSYSHELTTPSGAMDGQLPEEVRRDRRNQLLAAQQQVAYAWSQAQVGRQMDVILDNPVRGQPQAFVGRTYADAPEVDCAGLYQRHRPDRRTDCFLQDRRGAGV